MLNCGIDPGISGALCSIDADTREVSFWDTPTTIIKSGKKLRTQMDVHQCSAILRALRDQAVGELLVTIEKVAPMPSIPGPDGGERRTMGVTSSFNFGMGFGMWIAICAALEIPYLLVHPATWKAALMKDQGKEKDASRVKAMQLYPHTAKDLARKKDHARGDALLLAHYGMVGGATRPVQRPAMSVVASVPQPVLFGDPHSHATTSRTKPVEDEEDFGLGKF